ncbi:MAG: YidB family protein [Acidobacteriota bacterium]|nr:YidB family protein [Acidobacteriota bacterium]
MALFDSVLTDAEKRFKLGEKGAPLVNALVSLIETEGLARFLERFRRAGLGKVADSWIAVGANTPLSQTQLQDSLGKETLQNLANKAEIPIETATPALAAMIPQVVDLMTPDGVLRNPGKMSETAAENSIEAVSTDSGGSLLSVVLPLILLAFLVGIGFYTCRPNQETRLVQPATGNSNAAMKSNTAQPSKPAHDGH